MGVIKKALFGEKSAKGYQSQNVGNYENQLSGIINKRLADPMAGYDFSPTDESIEGYRGTNYNPYQFNFAQLPEEYAATAYAQGAKGIQRQSAGDLEKLREGIGARRPGLFAKAAESSQRNTQEQLAGLNAQTQLQRMAQNVELGRAQQEAQARENMAGSNFNLQKYGGLAQLGANKIGLQNELQNQPVQQLEKLYGTALQGTNQGAQVTNAGRKKGLLGSLVGLGAKAGLAYATGGASAGSGAGSGALAGI